MWHIVYFWHRNRSLIEPIWIVLQKIREWLDWKCSRYVLIGWLSKSIWITITWSLYPRVCVCVWLNHVLARVHILWLQLIRTIALFHFTEINVFHFKWETVNTTLADVLCSKNKIMSIYLCLHGTQEKRNYSKMRTDQGLILK